MEQGERVRWRADYGWANGIVHSQAHEGMVTLVDTGIGQLTAVYTPNLTRMVEVRPGVAEPEA